METLIAEEAVQTVDSEVLISVTWTQITAVLVLHVVHLEVAASVEAVSVEVPVEVALVVVHLEVVHGAEASAEAEALAEDTVNTLS